MDQRLDQFTRPAASEALRTDDATLSRLAASTQSPAHAERRLAELGFHRVALAGDLLGRAQPQLAKQRHQRGMAAGGRVHQRGPCHYDGKSQELPAHEHPKCEAEQAQAGSVDLEDAVGIPLAVHPHNAEILSGQLVAPGIPDVAEKALMKDKMNSYGKTWHVWHTGAMGQRGDPLPLGPAMLAWSFNRDGEARPGLVERRDERMGIDSAEKRRQRADLRSLAKPQSGVDDLKAAFPYAKPIPGVVGK